MPSNYGRNKKIDVALYCSQINLIAEEGNALIGFLKGVLVIGEKDGLLEMIRNEI